MFNMADDINMLFLMSCVSRCESCCFCLACVCYRRYPVFIGCLAVLAVVFVFDVRVTVP